VVASRIAPVASITTKHAPNWRVATMRRSIIGFRRLASHGIISTNASTQTAAISTMKDEANQSSSSPRSSMISSAPRKVATNTKPTRSNPPCSCSRLRCSATSLGAGRIAAISARAITPTGTLIIKHQRQERLSASQPPNVGPTTGATTTATPNSAKPWPRFFGGNESARIDCASGTMPPPPRPWTSRNKSSVSRFQAYPHNSELAVKRARQVKKKALRPSNRARKLLAVRLTALATR